VRHAGEHEGGATLSSLKSETRGEKSILFVLVEVVNTGNIY